MALHFEERIPMDQAEDTTPGLIELTVSLLLQQVLVSLDIVRELLGPTPPASELIGPRGRG